MTKARVKGPSCVTSADEGAYWWGMTALYLQQLSRWPEERRRRFVTIRIEEMAPQLPTCVHLVLDDDTKTRWQNLLGSIQKASDAVVKEASLRAKTNHKTIHRGLVANAIEKYRDWVVNMASSKCGVLHRRFKTNPSPINESEGNGQMSATPSELMEARSRVWKEKWTAVFSFEDFCSLFAEVRKRAARSPLEKLTVERLDMVGFTQPNSKGRGIDAFGPADYKALPNGAKSELCDIFTEAEQRIQWPWQLLANMVFLTVKPNGKDRALGLLPWLVRLWAGARKAEATVWLEAADAPWDQAIKGSSALRAALLRSFADEMVLESGGAQHFVSCAWDFDGFYDRLQPCTILREALKWGYPPVILGLEMLTHLAPRYLRVGEAFSQPIGPTTSILFGIRGANDFGRCVLFSVLREVHLKYMPAVTTNSWVDDIVQRVQGSWEKARAAAIVAGCCLVRGCTELGLSLSPKSKIIASSAELGRAVVDGLAQHGIAVKYARSVADLGIDRGLVRRGRLKESSRRKAAMMRQQRFSHLAKSRKTRPVAAKLWLTGVRPSDNYSSRVFGASQTHIGKCRRKLAIALNGAKSGRCLTTTLELLAGDADPAYDIPLGLLDSWILVITSGDEQRTAASSNWDSLVERISSVKGARRRSEVGGTAAAIVSTLLDLGWTPHKPWEWTDDCGTTYGVRDENILSKCESDDFDALRNALRDSIRRRCWNKARGFRHAEGIDEVPYLGDCIRQLRSLKRSNRHELYGAMLAIVTGSVWPRMKLAELGVPCDCTLCMRCEVNVPETDYHRTWECPANLKIKEIKETEKWMANAVREWEAAPAIWLRGMLPNSAVCVPENPTDDDTTTCGNLPADKAEGLQIVGGGDASGGAQAGHQLLMRAWMECLCS